MATVYAVEEIKKDVQELVGEIAIEDKISKVHMLNIFRLIKWSFANHWSKEKLLEEVEEYSNREIFKSRNCRF